MPSEENPDTCDALLRDWEIDGLFIDGIDSLSSFMANEGYCTTYTFEETDHNYYFIGTGCNGNPPYHQYFGIWDLSIDNINFYFVITEPEPYYPLFTNSPTKYWTIQEINNEKIRLKQIYQNRNYELHFKAK